MRTPLLAPNCRIVARRGGQDIDRTRFLQDVAALALRLPQASHVINLCRDRTRFMVGFAAALTRGQISLLPPAETPGLLDGLAITYPGVVMLHDGHAPPCTVPAFLYPPDLEAGDETSETPSFPDEQVAAVLFTSGSTGTPQPHPRSWGMLARSSRAAGSALGVAVHPGAALIGTVPHQHSYGLESLVMLALQNGLVLHGERPFYPADIRASLAEAPHPRILVTTPVHLRALLDDPATLPEVDLILSATAPLSPALATAAETRLGGVLHEIYGCSEAGQLAHRRTVQTDEWCCLPGVALRREPSDTGMDTWVDAAAGHLPIAARTRLGDIVELRDTTRFVLLGRTGDLVNIAGKRTSLAHLAFHLTAIDGVQDGVFVMADDGPDCQVRRLVAFAVAPGRTEVQILAGLRTRIDPAFLPRPLHIVSALPRNPVGKLTAEGVRALLAGVGDL